MRLYFIRHGKTAGNLEGRYIGVTDEPLCAVGRRELELGRYPEAAMVISSPLRRCVDTAKIIYPGLRTVLCDGLRECDFGEFEGKNHAELDGSPVYQIWIDSGGEMAFPGGEDKAGFSARTAAAFESLIPALADGTAFIVHGGTIMAIFEKYALPKRAFYDWNTGNGRGWEAAFDGRNLRVSGEI